MAGKTGTAQNSHGEDNSVFVAFAPRDNPKIAIAVVVENGGQGATWAAPIASFMVEKYLRDSISRRPSGITPEYYMEHNLLPAVAAKAPVVKKPAADSAKDKPNIPQLKKAAPKQAFRGNKPNAGAAILPDKPKSKER
jgi:penicillin-binding protein 2